MGEGVRSAHLPGALEQVLEGNAAGSALCPPSPPSPLIAAHPQVSAQRSLPRGLSSWLPYSTGAETGPCAHYPAAWGWHGGWEILGLGCVCVCVE